MEEIAEQGQALGRAFFGVKLGGKNIVTGNGAGKAATVIGFGRAVHRVPSGGGQVSQPAPPITDNSNNLSLANKIQVSGDKQGNLSEFDVNI